MRELKKELWPHRVEVKQADYDRVVETWLGQRVGCYKDTWNVVYMFDRTHYYFKNSTDATMFALRWSHV